MWPTVIKTECRSMLTAKSQTSRLVSFRLAAPPLWVAIGLPLCYFAAGSLSIYAFGINTPIWVSNGLVVTTLLRQRRASWPLLLLLAAAADFAANAVNGSGPGVALLICPCDTLEIALIATALTWSDETELPFATVPQMARFALVCLLVPGVSSAAGSGLLSAMQGDPFLAGWRTWYLSTTFGQLIVTPLLLCWTNPGVRTARSSVAIATAVAPSVLVAAVGYIDFNDHLPGLFFAFPFLLFATFSGRLLGATTASAALTAVAIWSTLQGHWPIAQSAGKDVIVQMEFLQLYLVAVFITALPVAVILEQREKLTNRLRETTAAAQAAALAKSEFLAVMSHEIRTPMTGVLGMADLLMEADLPKKELRYVAGIKTSGRYLLALVNDILDFSRIESGKLELEVIDCAIPEVLEQVRSLLAPQAIESDLELSFILDPWCPPVVRGDPTRLKQILVNLAANGIKFTKRGGVTVAVHHRVDDDHRHWLEFEVSDTGMGIPEGQRGTLFEAFSQGDSSTTRQFGGSGLGLAISKRLVEAMGGRLQVESAIGVGSRFWFELQVSLGETPAADEAISNGPISATPLAILLAEDVELNQVLVADMLHSHGHTVTLANDGEEAVRLAALRRFDVILMDVQMPIMDGVEATRRIRLLPSPACDVPVVAFSANVMAQDRDRYLAAGMNDTLAKPIDWPKLFKVLSKYGVANSSSGIQKGIIRSPPETGSEEAHRSMLTSSMSGESPLDLTILLRLQRLRAGSSELTTKVAELFLRDSTLRLENMRKALHHGDAPTVAALAHAIKGSSANLGATIMFRLCTSIEADAEVGNLASVPLRLENLEHEFARAKEALLAQLSAT
jgi:signal transduction histidine kinase/CheY-like chemotaxis protein